MIRSLDFADFALSSFLEASRSIKMMEKIDAAINWSRVEAVLLQHYTVGTIRHIANLEIDSFRKALVKPRIQYGPGSFIP